MLGIGDRLVDKRVQHAAGEPVGGAEHAPPGAGGKGNRDREDRQTVAGGRHDAGDDHVPGPGGTQLGIARGDLRTDRRSRSGHRVQQPAVAIEQHRRVAAEGVDYRFERGGPNAPSGEEALRGLDLAAGLLGEVGGEELRGGARALVKARQQALSALTVGEHDRGGHRAQQEHKRQRRQRQRSSSALD